MQQVQRSDAPHAPGLVAASGGLEILVVVLAACLPLRPTLSGLPLSTMAAGLLVFLAAFRRPTAPGRTPRVAGLAFVALVLWMVGASSVLHGLEVRRAGNLLVLMALAWVLSQGRIHLPSFVAGLMLGWSGGILHAVLTRDESTYDGRITGYLGDPNGAGFVIVTIGCLLIAYARGSGRTWWPIWAVTGVAVLLTVSRTSLFAFLAATLWALVGPRLGRWGSVVAIVVAWPAYQMLVGMARDSGFFAERAGSDDLRQRLAVIEGVMADQAGLMGLGLGTAKAVVDRAPLWFHNSYQALRVEGGLVAITLLGLCLLALFWSIHQVPAERRNAWYESAILAGLICSLNIGFSLTSVSMAVAVGMYAHYWRQSVGDRGGGDDPPRVPLLAARADAPAPHPPSR